jgi:hypothetical protein
MSQTHEVVVVRTPTGYRVTPGYVVVSPFDTIVWRNCTQAEIEVRPPRWAPWQRKSGAPLGEPSSEGGVIKLALQKADPGFYPYDVFSTEANDLCLGGSGPGVIIKG